MDYTVGMEAGMEGKPSGRQDFDSRLGRKGSGYTTLQKKLMKYAFQETFVFR